MTFVEHQTLTQAALIAASKERRARLARGHFSSELEIVAPHQFRKAKIKLPWSVPKIEESAVIHNLYTSIAVQYWPPHVWKTKVVPRSKWADVATIQKIVARHYDVSRTDMLSARRTANVVRPRQIAMYLAKTLTLHSLPDLGRRFGGRDHTTVLYAVRRIVILAADDPKLAAEIEILKAAILATLEPVG